MNNHPLISVIVPVYNVEKYLRKCLDSICGQTYRNLEILCVNDGSTDDSAAILEEYAARDERIRIYHQQNAGQSTARNLALKHAKGQWITGVDSDDYLDNNTYEYAVTAINEQVDIICFGTRVVWINRTEEPHLQPFYDLSVKGEVSVTPNVISDTNDSICNKLWRKSLIDKLEIQFPAGLWYEDSFFWRAVAPFARTITFLPAKKYNYIRRDNSTMSQVFQKSTKTMDRVHVAEHLMDYYSTHPLPKNLVSIKLLAFLFYFTSALSDVPKELHPQVWIEMRRIAEKHRLFEQWPRQLRFLRPVPLLLRPFVRHQGPGKSSYGVPGFRPLVIQRKNGMKIIRFLGIKLLRTPF